MSLRERYGKWHFRFQFQRREYSGDTGLAAIPQNIRKAQQYESDYLGALQQGRRPSHQIEVKAFTEAIMEFLPAAETNYREHPNSYKRIKTSLSSAQEFFAETPVSMIDGAAIDNYKTFRIGTHEVRDITLRHDLHALSTFFGYAIRHHWAFANPIDDVDIPSDADAERIHVLTPEEEQAYFERAKPFPNLHDLGRLMINQGLRPEEITCLAKSDIDLRNRQIHIRRGKSRAAKRVLDMTAESEEILTRRISGESPWMFPSSRKRGGHIARINSAHDAVVAEAAREGIVFAFVPYDFRHTFATRVAIESKTDLATLAALLGHVSLRCVQKYLHVQADHKKAAMKRYDRAQTMRRKRLARSGR